MNSKEHCYQIYISKVKILENLLVIAIIISAAITYLHNDFTGELQQITGVLLLMILVLSGALTLSDNIRKLFQEIPEIVISYEGIHFYIIGFIDWSSIDAISIKKKRWWHHFIKYRRANAEFFANFY